jgi:hypothetical protein
MVPKPHISGAIKGLRRWVVLSASVVALAAVTQGLVFGFVHYTDVRQDEIKPAPPKELRVVEGNAHLREHTADPAAAPARSASADAPLLGPGALMDTQRDIVGGVRGNLLTQKAPVDPNKITTAWDTYLRETSTLAAALGSVAAVVLCGLVFMGAVVAGGGGVPGVEKAVTSAFWSMVLAGLVLPWKDVMPSLPVPGIFAPYADLVAASDAARQGASAAAMFAQWLVLPMLAGLCATLVATWFCAGVRRGVIVTSVTEFDKQIEREVAEIAKRGGAKTIPSAGRTLGALNRAIGDTPADSLSALEGASSVAASLVRETHASLSSNAFDNDAHAADRVSPGRHPGRLI